MRRLRLADNEGIARVACAASLALATLIGAACARAVPVPQRAGDATDGPGSSGAAAGSPAAPDAARPGSAAGRGAAPRAGAPNSPTNPLIVEADPNGPQGGAPPPDLPPVPPAEIKDVDLPALRAELARFKAARRPVLVNYWATWCGPCVQELPELGEQARAWGDRGPAVLGVSLDRLTAADDSRLRAQVEEMLRKARVSYPNRIIGGDQAKVLDALTIGDGIPVTILYDATGRVAKRWEGGVNRALLSEATRLLGGEAPPADQARGAVGGGGS